MIKLINGLTGGYMNRFFYTIFYALLMGIQLCCHGMQSDQVSQLQKHSAKDQCSLTNQSAEVFLNQLVVLIEQEANSNNNTTNEMVIKDLPSFLRTYVPDDFNCYSEMLEKLFLKLLDSEKLSAKDKLTLITNHAQKTRKVGNKQKQVISQGLWTELDLSHHRDLVKDIASTVQQIPNLTIQELQTYIFITFTAPKKDDIWISEFCLEVIGEIILGKVGYSFEQKFRLLKSLFESKNDPAISLAKKLDFFYDHVKFLCDYILDQVDLKKDSNTVVRQIDEFAYKIAQMLKLDQLKSRRFQDMLFSALMLSNKISLQMKGEIWFDMLAYFGPSAHQHKVKYILQFIKKHFTDPNENIGVNSIVQKENAKTTLLHLAIDKIHQNRDLVNCLITIGANVNAQDDQGRTPLYNALELGSRDTVRFLIRKGARVDVKDKKNKTPLHAFLAYLEHLTLTDDVVLTLVEELLIHGSPTDSKDDTGKTILDLVCTLPTISQELRKSLQDLLVKYSVPGKV